MCSVPRGRARAALHGTEHSQGLAGVGIHDPNSPFLSFPAPGQGMELDVQGSLLSVGNSSGSKIQKGVGVDSWAPCYGVICGMLVFLLPFILPSVKQAFSLVSASFPSLHPHSNALPLLKGFGHWCKKILLLPCPAALIFLWWDVVLAVLL